MSKYPTLEGAGIGLAELKPEGGKRRYDSQSTSDDSDLPYSRWIELRYEEGELSSKYNKRLDDAVKSINWNVKNKDDMYNFLAALAHELLPEGEDI